MSYFIRIVIGLILDTLFDGADVAAYKVHSKFILPEGKAMNDIQHFSKLIKDIKYTMLTTIDEMDGSLHSRPMTLQESTFDGNLWFFANHSSELARQIEKNPRVNLAFANIKDSSYLSASGQAEILFDRQKAEELWNPVLKAWFPKG